MGRVEGKVALVTGGGSGIGEACAMRLAREGAGVSVVDISAAGAERVAAAIVAAGGRAVPVVADVSDEDQVRRMVATTVSELGRLDILHNNAALVAHEVFRRDGTVTEMDLEVWEAIMAVNLRGPMLGTKHAVPVMIDGGGGSIVNMSSGSSQLGDIERSAYGASKAGVNALTLYTATQYGRQGVRANAILPGLVLTPAAATNLPADVRVIVESNVLTPFVGEPDDIAHLVTYLASDESRYVTGQLFPGQRRPVEPPTDVRAAHRGGGPVTGPAGNPDRFAGKVAVVVGSATGIGAATARQLAADGASVVVADVVADGAARVASAIEDGGGRAVAVEVELRDEASVGAMVEATLDRFGRIDALHNNAADTRPSTIGNDTDVVDIDLAIWDQTLAVDLTGFMLTCRHVIPAMLATGGGAILNTSSLAGLRGESQRVGYAVAKAGVHALTRHVALRWGKEGIRCNAMALGVVMTEALVTGITPEFRAQLVASLHVPDEGTPADIARVASFLLSDDARYVNGATIPVDGGMGVGLGG